MDGQFEILRLMGDLIILLMSMTIPTYAIAVSFLGREHSRVTERLVAEREKAEKELQEGIQSTDINLDDIEQRVEDFRRREEEIKGVLKPLSIVIITIFPSIFFGSALLFTALAMYFYPMNIKAFYIITVVLISLGLIAFGWALRGINKVAQELAGGST